MHSHPAWLVERWLARFGELETASLLRANNRTPRLSCSVHNAKRRDDILNGLQESGLRLESGLLLNGAFAVNGGSPTRTEAFQRGDISIQDEASQAIPLLLDVQPGDAERER